VGDSEEKGRANINLPGSPLFREQTEELLLPKQIDNSFRAKGKESGQDKLSAGRRQVMEHHSSCCVAVARRAVTDVGEERILLKMGHSMLLSTKRGVRREMKCCEILSNYSRIVMTRDYMYQVCTVRTVLTSTIARIYCSNVNRRQAMLSSRAW
jgi:hypothetical protein